MREVYPFKDDNTVIHLDIRQSREVCVATRDPSGVKIEMSIPEIDVVRPEEHIEI